MRSIVTTLILAGLFISKVNADEMLTFETNTGEQTDIDCMAEAMYWEGSGEGRLGMYLIGEVIKNRTDDTTYEFKHLSNACGVVQQPSRSGVYHECAFSYKCDGKSEDVFNNKINKEAFELAYTLAYNVITNSEEFFLDIANGALYYTRTEVWRDWMSNTEVTITYLDHTFRKRLGQEERTVPQPEVVVEKTCITFEEEVILDATNKDFEWRFTYE